MEEQNQQQPAPQPEKPNKKFYKKPWFWLVAVIVLAISIFYFYSTTQTDIIGDFAQLGEVNININNTFPNPPCSNCNLGIKPTQIFDNLKSEYKRCEINNDCITVSYSGNPDNQCGFTVVPINKTAGVLIQSEMNTYFEAYEAGETRTVCGMPFTSPAGVKCVKRECKIILKDINGIFSIEK